MENIIRKSSLDHSNLTSTLSLFYSRSTASDARAAAIQAVRLRSSRAWPKPPPEIIAVAATLIDLALVLMTAACVFFEYFRILRHFPFHSSQYFSAVILTSAVFIFLFWQFGGYSLQKLHVLSWQMYYIALAWMLTVSLLLLIAFAGKTSGDYSRSWAFAWFFATPVILISGRLAMHWAASRWLREGLLARKIIIVGAGRECEKVLAKLQNCSDKSIIVKGIFDDQQIAPPQSVRGVPVLGTTDDLLRYARRETIDQVIIASPIDAEDQLSVLFEKLSVIPADLRLSVDSIAERFSVCGIGHLSDVLLLEIASRPLNQGGALCKWLTDKLVAFLLLVLLGPLMAFVGLLIKLDSKGPIFFVQERFGLRNNVIRVLKFRTMYVHRGDETGVERTVYNDPRITRIGRYLRMLSLDELPQLINVLAGDMSLVGPRPHAIAMRAGNRLYHEAVARYPHRHRVKPGLTGWAQVNGLRGEVDTLEKANRRVECDLFYIANWSLWLDLKILWMTVGLLLSRENAY